MKMIYTLDALQLLYLSLKCYLIDILHDNLMKAEKSPINSCINQVISTMSWSNGSVTVGLPVTSPVLETLLTSSDHCGPSEAVISGLCSGSEL